MIKFGRRVATECSLQEGKMSAIGQKPPFITCCIADIHPFPPDLFFHECSTNMDVTSFMVQTRRDVAAEVAATLIDQHQHLLKSL